MVVKSGKKWWDQLSNGRNSDTDFLKNWSDGNALTSFFGTKAETSQKVNGIFHIEAAE